MSGEYPIFWIWYEESSYPRPDTYLIEQTFPRREMFRIEEYTYCLRNTDRKRP
jgi:hypothetical protein